MALNLDGSDLSNECIARQARFQQLLSHINSRARTDFVGNLAQETCDPPNYLFNIFQEDPRIQKQISFQRSDQRMMQFGQNSHFLNEFAFVRFRNPLDRALSAVLFECFHDTFHFLMTIRNKVQNFHRPPSGNATNCNGRVGIS
jgi:hypothetical protein